MNSKLDWEDLISNSTLAASAFFLFVLCFFLVIRIPIKKNLPIFFKKLIQSQYSLHHYVGLLCFFLVIIHVFFSWNELGTSIFTIADYGFTTGWAAFLGFLLLLIFSYTIRTYKKWKSTHLFFILLFFLMYVHGAFFTQNLWQHYFITTLGVCGIALSHILNKFSNYGFRFVLKQHSIQGKNHLLTLQRKNNQHFFDCQAGQYVRVRIPKLSRHWHPFSISEFNAQELHLIVKELGGDTAHFSDLKIDDEFDVDGPFGFWHSDAPKQIWIAGGVGIVPFVARAHEYKGQYQVFLSYSAKTKDDLLHLELFQKLTHQFPQSFTFRVFLDEDGKKITDSEIKELLKDFDDAEVLLCGPPAFSRYIHQLLPNRKIIEEEYRL